jgi:predicted nucleic acid-binding Zn ribbon protein
MAKYHDPDKVRVTHCVHCGKALGKYANKYCSRACGLHRVPQRDRVRDPTPLEIAIRSAQIRRTWSERVRRERAVIAYQTPCTIPFLTSDFRTGEYHHDHAESVVSDTVVEPSDAGPGDIPQYEMPDL